MGNAESLGELQESVSVGRRKEGVVARIWKDPLQHHGRSMLAAAGAQSVCHSMGWTVLSALVWKVHKNRTCDEM